MLVWSGGSQESGCGTLAGRGREREEELVQTGKGKQGCSPWRRKVEGKGLRTFTKQGGKCFQMLQRAAKGEKMAGRDHSFSLGAFGCRADDACC